MTKKKVKVGSNTIALNKRARHEYFIEDEIEAGLELQGWEVKSMRAGKANISDSYIIFKNGEAYLFGATIQPLSLASTHVVCDPTRTRKLLLNKRELDIFSVNQAVMVLPLLPFLFIGKVLGQRSKSVLRKVKTTCINVMILKSVNGK